MNYMIRRVARAASRLSDDEQRHLVEFVTLPDAILEENNSPSMIESLPKNTWIPWISKVTFASDSRVIGPGEQRAMDQLRLKPVHSHGTIATVDLIDPKTKLTWEVKGLEGSEARIRPGQSGREVATRFINDVVKVTAEIGMFFDKLKRLEIKILRDFEFDIDAIMKFVKNEGPMLEKGELSRQRIISDHGLYGVVKRINAFIDQVRIDTSSKKKQRPEEWTLSITGARGVNIMRTLDLARYIKVADAAGIEFEHMRVHVAELTKHAIQSKYIDDPEQLIYDWTNLAKPEDIFKHVSGGIIIAHDKKGLFIIPKKDLNRYIQFNSITKSELKLKFVDPDRTAKKAA